MKSVLIKRLLKEGDPNPNHPVNADSLKQALEDAMSKSVDGLFVDDLDVVNGPAANRMVCPVNHLIGYIQCVSEDMCRVNLTEYGEKILDTPEKIENARIQFCMFGDPDKDGVFQVERVFKGNLLMNPITRKEDCENGNETDTQRGADD